MKTVFQATFSKDSFGNIAKKIELYGKQLEQGVNIGVEKATKQLYELIIKKCEENNITIHKDEIKWKYYYDDKIGKVWTNDIVIIFNEFGTGINGIQDEWANTFGYQVNMSGKGEKGWYFKNEDHNYDGITHGILSKHIFYESLIEIRETLPKTIGIEVSKTVGKMY